MCGGGGKGNGGGGDEERCGCGGGDRGEVLSLLAWSGGEGDEPSLLSSGLLDLLPRWSPVTASHYVLNSAQEKNSRDDDQILQ